MVPTRLGLRVFFAKTLAVVCIGILLLAPLAVLGYQGAEQNGTVGPYHLAAHAVAVQSRGAPHAPIHISGNDDFASQATNESWPGDGTEQNPYIIAGYEIDGNGGGYCIWIENTDVWFVIRNCKVWNVTIDYPLQFGTGIFLNDVTHGTLHCNNCSGNLRFGIYLYFSSNNTITNNTCSGNGWDGIRLYSSSNTVITHNLCIGNGCGMKISGHQITVMYNNCSWNQMRGIETDAYPTISDSVIAYNDLYRNGGYGIVIDYGGYHNQIHHNNFIENNGATSPAIPYPQAADKSGNNLWYDPETKEGNYWSNWNGKGAYEIGLGEDPYPLGHKVGEESLEWLYWLIAIIVITVIVICIAIIVVRRHKKKRMEVEAKEGNEVELGNRETAVPVVQGEKMVCSRCGAVIPGDANYCPFCASKVR